MSWESAGIIAEIIAATAVVISLMYVGLQIRDNTRVAKAESRRTHSDYSIQYLAAIGSSTEAISIFRRGQTEPETLTEDELTRFVFQFAMIAAQVESAYSDHLLGIIDYHAMDYRSARFIQLLGTPGGKIFLKMSSSSLMPEFRAYIKNALSEANIQNSSLASQGT